MAPRCGHADATCAGGICGRLDCGRDTIIAKGSKKPPHLYDVFIEYLLPLLDPMTLYYLAACSSNLWVLRMKFLELRSYVDPKCICWSIYNCSRTCTDFLAEKVPRHYPGCASQGRLACEATAHQCTKHIFGAPMCTCNKCVVENEKARFKKKYTTDALIRKKNVSAYLPVNVPRCVCVICSDTRVKWLASPGGRLWQRQEEARRRQKEVHRRQEEEMCREQAAAVAEQRQKLLAKGYIEDELDENHCRFGLCSDGKECYTCHNFFCAWRVCENICYECEDKQIESGIRYERIYRP